MSKTNTICDCGCDVRGLTEYQLTGYRKNYDKKTFISTNNKKVTVNKYLENAEPLIHINLGYTDEKTSIQKAKNIINKSRFNNVEWFEVWDITNTELVKTI